ncbi:MAG: hypothetical protein FWB81_06770 [Cystobacterineae bacterium]|nr:hypothetical protein [Cystobacterineae bacterium]
MTTMLQMTPILARLRASGFWAVFKRGQPRMRAGMAGRQLKKREATAEDSVGFMEL